jgi:hypothetical protein
LVHWCGEVVVYIGAKMLDLRIYTRGVHRRW